MTSSLQPLLVGSVLAALACASVIVMTIVIRAVRYGGRRDDRAVHEETLSASRFASPVSLVVPLVKSAQHANRTIAAALALNYADLEVVVVASELSDTDFEDLKRTWQLTAREFFYQHVLETAPVRRIYRSGRDPRLMLVEKAAGPYADALNCGANLARFGYMVAVDPNITFDQTALLRTMTAAFREKEPTVGISAHIEHRLVHDGPPGLAGCLQWLESVRAQAETRLTPQNERVGLGLHETIFIWRRDAVLEAQGFSAQRR